MEGDSEGEEGCCGLFEGMGARFGALVFGAMVGVGMVFRRSSSSRMPFFIASASWSW